MNRANACERVTRVLGTAIVAVFLFGSVSGPLRTCLSHPTHASGSHGGMHSAPQHAAAQGATQAPSHGATHGDTHGETAPAEHVPATDHAGCSCLGRCSLENAPGLPGSFGPTTAQASDAPRATVAASVRVYTGRDPFQLPLARPPPAVV